MCPKCNSDNIAGNGLQFHCETCGYIWSPLDEEKEQEIARVRAFAFYSSNHSKNCVCHVCETKEARTHWGDGSVYDPTPKFKQIEKGICPDCNGTLTEDGNCIDCHVTPALDPEFQEWLWLKG